MVINPNILTVSPVIYLLVLLAIYAVYTYSKWGKEEISTGIGMCFLDILPSFALVFLNFRTGLLEWFIIAILFAMISIRVHIVVGAISYLLIYLAIGISAMTHGIQVFSLIVSTVIICALIAYTITLKSVDKRTKIGGILYGIFALIPLLYCFGTTWNFGFLSLVIGDILLAITQIVPKNREKLVNYISNMFFYTGVWLVPLSLINF